MIIAVPSETFPNERRVALVPNDIARLSKLKCDVHVQSGAGQMAGYLDSAYRDKGATIVADRGELFKKAAIVAQVRAGGANLDKGQEDLSRYREG